MALKRVAIPSPFYSSRGGSTVTTIVLHTAEGARDIYSLGSWFQNPSANVSSHTGADDTPNTVGEYVQRSGKAWTQAAANPWCVSLELCGFASWSAGEWQNNHSTMLANAAAWIAEEAAYFHIPVQRLTPAGAQNPATMGVCMHSDLGSMGGNHSDCGAGFPMDQVVAMACGQPAPSPTPPSPAPSTQGDENMILQDPTSKGLWVVVPDAIPAAVWTYDGAPYLGATNSTKFNASKYPCVGIARYVDGSGEGYTLVLDWGDSGKGDGKSKDGTGDRFRRYHYPRSGSGK